MGPILLSELKFVMLVTQLLHSGILVAEDRQWRKGDKTGFSGELAEIIDERLERVTVLGSWEMRLFG